MFMLKTTHEAEMAAKDAEITTLAKSLHAAKTKLDEAHRTIEIERATVDALDKSAKRFKRERDEAVAKVDRMTAPLRAANAARRAKAANGSSLTS